MVAYHLYDLHQSMLQPFGWLAEGVRRTMHLPDLPNLHAPMTRLTFAGASLLERATRRFGKPSFGLQETTVNGDRVRVGEEVVLAKPFCNLLHFVKDADVVQPRVLIVAPMSGHHATLLRGTVEAMLPDHDVYITDWTDARLVPLSKGRFDLDDYIDHVIAFLHHLGPQTHVLAVCQPTVPTLAAVSLMASADDDMQPRSMVLMGGPIDPSANPTVPVKLATSRPLSWFERTVISRVPVYYPGALRRVYPGFVQLTGFMSMNLDRHINAHLTLFRDLVRGDGESAAAHERFYDEYLAVMDLTAEFYLQTIDTVFQKQSLARGTMVSRGRPIEPAAIRRTALMTVEGELDDISAPAQTVAAHRLCSNLPEKMHRNHLQEGAGHYGIFNGRRWREQVMPKVRDFIREHD
ncbi:MAG TPA: polyhydroxyalkanoate depolymerase [Azospirillum sp.]|nr:polyhydroxyalkanoate depolymerase [Azospirillum sp.]